MNLKPILAAFGAALVCLIAQPALAQAECPCDCYFSSDCNGGAFCDWGNLSIEDSCFWRTPKPQGSPGAGCDQDYNNWGQCDGICTGAAATTMFRDERVNDLVSGLNLWADALTATAQTGGGYPSPDALKRIWSIDYKEPRMSDSMWRIVVEVLILTMGSDTIVFPTGMDVFHSEQAQIKDVSNDPLLLELANLSLQALLAEIEAAGSGRPYLEQAAALGLGSRLEQGTFDRVCRENLGTGLDCLYVRLADMGEAIGRAGRDVGASDTVQALEGGVNCGEEPPGECLGDADMNGEVNVQDLLIVILRWGPVPHGHPADFNGDDVVDVQDMLEVILNWGPCP